MNSSRNYLIISEQRVFTDALTLFLAQSSGAGEIAKANNAEDAFEFAQQMNSGIAILDCDLPPDGPFDLASRIRSHNSRIQILLMLDSPSPLMICQALKIGIENIFLKTNSIHTLLLALDDVANGKSYLSRKIREQLNFDDQRNRHFIRIDSGLQTLTDREIEVLRHISRGYSVKEVSEKMHLSPKSVDSHKYRIMSKLDIHDRVLLSRYCIREGLIQP